MAEQTAELHLPDGRTATLPVVIGSENEPAIDITRLRAQTGYVTLDNGFANTAPCKSAITYIDGEKGILRFRGIPIQELAEHSNFVEASYLLIYGELPTKERLEAFERALKNNAMINESFRRFFNGFPRDAHPMAILASVVTALYTFYSDWTKHKENGFDVGVIRLLAKLPTMAAFAYKTSIGQPIIYPRANLSYCENYLHMMFATPMEDYELDPEVAKAMDLLLLLHADHEQNCSTSSVRLVGSSQSNICASVSAGISALWGPLHGGANQRVIEMLEVIKEDGGNVNKFVEMAKDKENPFRLMGFGHRVYKNFDPRATIVQDTCRRVLAKLHQPDPLLDIALELADVALNDEYFIERKLYPNVDYYSGIIWKALGIPVASFTVMFALGRLPGWIAQYREMSSDPLVRIGRPRQIYIGETERPYVPLDRRG